MKIRIIPLVLATILNQVQNDVSWIKFRMTLIVTVILTKVRIFFDPESSSGWRFLNQVQNDDNYKRHSDESIVLMKIRIIPLVLATILNQVQNDVSWIKFRMTLIVIVILTKVRIFFDPESSSGWRFLNQVQNDDNHKRHFDKSIVLMKIRIIPLVLAAILN